MRSTVEPVEPTKVRINVVVEPDELAPAIDRTARRLGREVRVPGFRKGKVPRQVIEARIGRKALVAEAIESEAVPEFYARALREHDLAPLSRAKVDLGEWTEGAPLEFSAEVEVKPELDLPPYRSIQVDRPDVEVTEADVDARLDRERERFAQLEVIGRPLAEGDFAQIDLRATRHLEEIPDLTRSDFLYELGSGIVVPKLDEELQGARKGDILKFNATLPEAAGEWAGQEVTFTVLVKEAKTKILPALDDDFAQEASEFDTLEQLRADIRARLQAAAEQQAAAELEVRVLDAYLAQVDVPLPGTLVRDELNYRATRFAQQLGMMGMTFEQYLEASGSTQEQVEADLRAQAERAVRVQLVLDEVAAAEGLQASDAEVDAEIARQAQRAGRDVGEYRRRVEQGPGVGAIRGDILRSKALALLVEHADVRPPQGQAEGLAGRAAAGDGE